MNKLKKLDALLERKSTQLNLAYQAVTFFLTMSLVAFVILGLMRLTFGEWNMTFLYVCGGVNLLLICSGAALALAAWQHNRVIEKIVRIVVKENE